MAWLSPTERKRVRIARWRLAAVLLAIGLALSLLDRTIYHALLWPDAERRDWYQLLRAVGYMPAWVIVGLAIALVDRTREDPLAPRPFWGRGALVAGSALLAGALCELGKLLIGRERPLHHDGWYHFKPLLGAFTDGSNLGVPSSHAGVAFGGAFMLIVFFPQLRTLATALAAGCAVTRMLSGAHFATDVYAGAVIAWFVAMRLGRLADRDKPGPVVEPIAGRLG